MLVDELFKLFLDAQPKGKHVENTSICLTDIPGLNKENSGIIGTKLLIHFHGRYPKIADSLPGVDMAMSDDFESSPT